MRKRLIRGPENSLGGEEEELLLLLSIFVSLWKGKAKVCAEQPQQKNHLFLSNLWSS